ncbi:unnamed protein product [Calypogeia fissa]
MTARKLPMPGLRDRTGGEEGGDTAAACRGGWGLPQAHAQQQQQQQQVLGNENGCAAAGGGAVAIGVARGEQLQQPEVRCSNSSTQAGGVASSIMQPLPLASRYVGLEASKHDTLHPTSSALGSSWIRRFLPATGGSPAPELGKEVTRLPKAVWGGGQGGQGLQAAAAAAGAGGESGSQQQWEGGMLAKAWMGLDSSGRETSGKVPTNGESTQKGKAPLEREERQERESRPEMAAGMYELAENDVKESHRKVNTRPSHAGGASAAVEGSSRLQQQQQHEGNHNKPVLPARGESHTNGGTPTTGAKLAGFGPFQVFKKPNATDYGKVGGTGAPKLKGMEGGEARVEADLRTAAQPDTHRFCNNNATDLLDRKHSGTSTMASHTGTKFTPSKSKVLESCAGEFSGAWAFPRTTTKKEDAEPDLGGGGRPFMAPQSDGGGGSRDPAAAAMGVGGGGGLKVSESAARFNPFGERNFKFGSEAAAPLHKFLDHESGVDRIQKGNTSKFIGDGLVSGYPLANNNIGSREDGGQATESKFANRAAGEDTIPMPNTGAGFPFPTGLENRKMKGVVGFGFPSSGRHTETGPSQQQQQHSQEVPIPFHALHPPFQGDLFTGKIGHPLPFSPHSSFPGEDNNSGEDTRNSKGKADRAKSPLFGALKAYEDGMDGRGTGVAQFEQHARWTSLYASFKGLKHADVENSSPSSPTLPVDVHSVLQDGSMPANRPFEAHNVSGDRDEAGEGVRRGRNDNAPVPNSPEARSRFDNQSSHFSSSPWPDEEGHIPNDDTGSGPCNSQATGSGYYSQASRVANRSSVDSKGKHMRAYRYDTGGGGETEGLDKAPRSRELSASEPDLRKYAGSQGEDEGQRTSYEVKRAHVFSIPVKHSPTQAMSGLKDDTSDSSPPSCPRGYNSSESPVLPRAIVDEHLLSIAGKLKNVDVGSEMEGSRVPRMHRGNRRDEAGFTAKRTKEYDNEAGYREHKDVRTFLSKDPDLQRAQTPVRDMNREVKRQGRSNEGLEPGLKHGKLRMSGEAMGEGGVSGSSKRTRYYFNPSSKDLGPQTAGSGMPSSWLTRWLPPSSNNAAKSPAVFARPKDGPRNGVTFEPPRSNGNFNFMSFSDDRSAQARMAEVARGKEIKRGNDPRARNGLKGFAKRGLLGLPPHPVPSAAAIALVGTAARKMGPFPQQRMGSVAMWPPVHLHSAQDPEGGQRSS